jgi:hypothetical protein
MSKTSGQEPAAEGFVSVMALLRELAPRERLSLNFKS